MATARETIKKWFSNFKRPTQEHFWAWLDSFWHKNEKIPMSSVQNLEQSLQNVVTSDQFDNHINDGNAHQTLFDGKLDRGTYVGNAKDLEAAINHKVDKADGKGLSTNDFTNSDKQKLDNTADKVIVSGAVTGEVNKILTLTYSDGTALHISFQDLGIDNIADIMLNSLNFNFETGVLTGVRSDGQQLTVSLDGRYSLLEHTHQINDVTGLEDALNGKAEATHTHSYNDLTDKPTIPEAYNIDAYSTYDYSKFTDLEYNKNLASGKYIATDNDRRLIFFIQNYPDGENTEIPVIQVQMMLQHGTTAMPNLRWIIKQANGTYVFSNGGSWFQFASTHYVSSRAFVHHRVNPTAQQLNDTIGNGIFTIQNYIVPNFPEPETYNGLIINFKGSNIFSQIFYITNGDMWSRGYLNGQWSTWKKLNDYRGLPKTFPFGRKESIGSLSIGNSLLEETNTFFLEGYEQTHKYINFDANIKNYSVISFMKCFNGGEVHFSHPNKTIIKLGADNFNGKKGSTAVVSVVDNEIYIQINNYE
ncbi:hypothetical protein [Capnocytophaga canimorsus]|uniref:hypothetical protein n=1 Tax=Capnocytophaga canimorsus TaxID=28188 RepID=UPI0037D24F90